MFRLIASLITSGALAFSITLSSQAAPLEGLKVANHKRIIRDVEWRPIECRYQGADGRLGFNRHEVNKTVRCIANKFNVSLDTALAIIDRESGFYPRATNSSSGACGLMQFYPASSFFIRRSRVLNARPRFEPMKANCYNARSNLLAGLWEARAYGWGAWGF